MSPVNELRLIQGKIKTDIVKSSQIPKDFFKIKFFSVRHQQAYKILQNIGRQFFIIL